jgi:hypothetical protein
MISRGKSETLLLERRKGIIGLDGFQASPARPVMRLG